MQRKESIRKTIQAKRCAVTAEQRIAAGQAARKQLIDHPLFCQSQHIAFYFPQQHEFDPLLLIQEAWHLEKKCYLPVIHSQSSADLEFVSYHRDSLLHLNHYHILEPEQGDKMAAKELDLVIIPLIAFDERGYRIGMGAGHYDRAFAFKREQVAKPYLLGLAYELQKVARVPNDVWDVALDGILTEEKLYTAKK